MKLIVILSQTQNLIDIKKEVAKIDEKRARSIIFTNDPKMVLTAVKDSPAIVISGRLVGAYVIELARQVKSHNSQAQFYMYGDKPHLDKFEQEKMVDGFIALKNKRRKRFVRGQEHSVLAKILTSNLEGATPETVMQISRFS